MIKYITVRATADLSSPSVVNAILDGWKLEGIFDDPYCPSSEADILDYSLTALKHSLKEHGFARLYLEK